MKKITLFLLLFYFSKSAFCQLTPSTVAEIYNFSVGDTFEYREIAYGVGLCNFEGNALFIITNFSRNADSITFNYKRINSRVSNYRCGGNGNGPYTLSLDSFYASEIIKNVDSSVFIAGQRIDKTITIKCDSFDKFCKDTVFISSKYNGKKQNSHYNHPIASEYNIWIDSLGLVSSNNYYENVIPSYSLELIYYHKANGETWGIYDSITKYYHGMFPWAVNDLNNSLQGKISPNPASTKLYIDFTATTSQATKLQIIDAVGKEVYTTTNYLKETPLDVQIFPAGMYFVLLENSEGRYRGRFVKE